jgi:hypothetical protein
MTTKSVDVTDVAGRSGLNDTPTRSDCWRKNAGNHRDTARRDLRTWAGCADRHTVAHSPAAFQTQPVTN